MNAPDSPFRFTLTVAPMQGPLPASGSPLARLRVRGMRAEYRHAALQVVDSIDAAIPFLAWDARRYGPKAGTRIVWLCDTGRYQIGY